MDMNVRLTKFVYFKYFNEYHIVLCTGFKFLFFWIYLFNSICVNVLACMYVCVSHAYLVAAEARRGIPPSRIGVMDSCNCHVGAGKEEHSRGTWRAHSHWDQSPPPPTAADPAKAFAIRPGNKSASKWQLQSQLPTTAVLLPLSVFWPRHPDKPTPNS